MNTEQRVIFSVTDKIATLTINREQYHNALGAAEVEQFSNHLKTIEQDKSIRVLTLTGAGDKTFCSGALLSDLQNGSLTSEGFEDLVCELADVSVPTIALFNGSAYGGGSELALACDFRLGVNGMRIKVPPAEIGLLYPPRGLERFVSYLGVNTTKRLLLAAETFQDHQLLEAGYLTRLLPAEDAPDVARAMAERLASMAPLAVQGMKKVLNQCAVSALDGEWSLQLAEACNASQDLQEGLAAKLEKREANFKGC